MTTKTTGQRITGLLALTFEAQAALEIGDPVHVTGPYEVDKADGTKAVVGFVSVPNKGRNLSTGAFPAAITPGDCTVEVRGFEVRQLKAGSAVDAGEPVGISADGKFDPVAIDAINKVGIALTAAAGDNSLFDCLVG